MAYVADDMNLHNYPEPIFIVQANNTEIFGNINSQLTTYLSAKFNMNLENDKLLTEQKDINENQIQDKSLVQLIQEKSDNEYCTKEEGYENIKLLKECFSVKKWTEEITNIFEINISELEDFIPNKKSIGQWLDENKDEKYFAKPIYEDETYYKPEFDN